MHEIAINNLTSVYSYKILLLLQSTNKTVSIKSATNELKTSRINANRGINELRKYGLIELVDCDRWEKFYRLKC